MVLVGHRGGRDRDEDLPAVHRAHEEGNQKEIVEVLECEEASECNLAADPTVRQVDVDEEVDDESDWSEFEGEYDEPCPRGCYLGLTAAEETAEGRRPNRTGGVNTLQAS